MKKTHSIAVILFALLFLNLISCEKDNITVPDNVQELSANKITQKTFNELLNDGKFKKAYSKTIKLKEQSLNSRTAMEAENNFTIDSSQVNIVTTDDFIFYTMRIERDEPHPSYSENLIIQIDSSNIPKAFVVKYTPSNLTPTLSHDSYSFNGKVETRKLKYDISNVRENEDCYEVEILMCNWSYGNVVGIEHLAGYNCTPSFTFWVTTDNCDDDNQSGGGSPGGTGGAPIIHPCDDPIHGCNLIAADLADLLELDFDQRDWLYDQDGQLIEDIEDIANVTSIEYGKDVVEALRLGNEVDLVEYYIKIDTPDDNYIELAQKGYIPSTLTLPNGDQISVTFGASEDGVTANQEVADHTLDGLIFALNEANNNLSANNKITSIYIKTTTNGVHSSLSNHPKGTAIDISRINGTKMIVSGVTPQITQLQNALDNFQYIRENFGPHFKHKYSIGPNTWNYNHPVLGHKDHIHLSTRTN